VNSKRPRDSTYVIYGHVSFTPFDGTEVSSVKFLREPQGLLVTSRVVSDSAEYSKREFFDRLPAFLLAA
jgi:hypothetical protein